MAQKEYKKHYEETVEITADASSVFNYADNPVNFSSHMYKSSWMMGGSKMETQTDDGKGQQIGSHIKMGGKILGINLFLDEVITRYEPPFRKEWETVGDIKLLVIDHYKLGFEIAPNKQTTKLKVFIDYNHPQSWGSRLLGILFGKMYASWCVRQMSHGVKKHFQNPTDN